MKAYARWPAWRRWGSSRLDGDSPQLPDSAARQGDGAWLALSPIWESKGGKALRPSPTRWFPSLLLAALFASAMGALSMAQETQLARTPPMGWSSWNHFACEVSDAIIRAQAGAMVSTGMKAAGYTYINIDDCWEGKRDPQGFIHGNAKFPDMKALADYVHSKGLKIGIYSSPGATTCEYYEGSLGHEEQDAQTYAEWGFDYLKYDWCYTKGDQIAANRRMYEAVRKTGRPMVFSLSGNSGRVWTWGASVGANLWRTTDDMRDNYYIMIGKGLSQAGLEKFAGPGHWNDPDMLEIGNGGMGEDEWRVQMSLWSILAAPLIATLDLTHAAPTALAILGNPELIAVDQDPAGVQGYRISQEGPLQIWTKPLADGSQAVGLFNFEDGTVPITVHFRDIGLGESAFVRDLWAGKDMGIFKESYTGNVPFHGVAMIKVRKQ